MAAKQYELRLRYRGSDYRDVEAFSRGLDFEQILDTDRFLLIQLIAAMKRGRLDPCKELDLCELEIWDKDRNSRDRVFAASQHELTDDLLR